MLFWCITDMIWMIPVSLLFFFFLFLEWFTDLEQNVSAKVFKKNLLEYDGFNSQCITLAHCTTWHFAAGHVLWWITAWQIFSCITDFFSFPFARMRGGRDERIDTEMGRRRMMLVVWQTFTMMDELDLYLATSPILHQTLHSFESRWCKDTAIKLFSLFPTLMKAHCWAYGW